MPSLLFLVLVITAMLFCPPILPDGRERSYSEEQRSDRLFEGE